MSMGRVPRTVPSRHTRSSPSYSGTAASQSTSHHNTPPNYEAPSPGYYGSLERPPLPIRAHYQPASTLWQSSILRTPRRGRRVIAPTPVPTTPTATVLTMSRVHYMLSCVLPWAFVALLSCILVTLLLMLIQKESSMIPPTPLEMARLRPNASIDERYSHFRELYPLSVTSEEDTARRREIFRLNVEAFDQFRREHPDADFGINQFSDWTASEMAHMAIPVEMALRNRDAALKGRLRPRTTIKLRRTRPAEFDWRDAGGVVTSIRSQHPGGCVSGWAVAAAGAVESAYLIWRPDHVRHRWRLSIQELIDCDVANRGCEGGDALAALKYVERRGLPLDHDYQYWNRRRPEESRKCDYEQIHRFTINDSVLLDTNEEVIADWLYSYGPITAVMRFPPWLFGYREGVITAAACKVTSKRWEGEPASMHSVILVGYGTKYDKPVWVVRNSWVGWGEGGFAYVERGADACGISQWVAGVLLEQQRAASRRRGADVRANRLYRV